MSTELAAEAVADYKRKYHIFLDTENADSKYMTKIKAMIESLSTRLVINISDMRDWDGPATEELLERPLTFLPVLEAAVKEVLLEQDATFFEKYDEKRGVMRLAAAAKTDRIFVGFEGNFGDASVTPRTLSAEHLGRAVALEGIVTRCSLVRPKVVRSVHYCPKTGKFQQREYRDATDAGGPPTGSVYPTKDAEGNKLETDYGMCIFKNCQTITLQEMPETAPLGQLPRSVDVYCEHDLVDHVKPGDRVAVIGVYRALASATAASISAMFRTVLLATNITRASRETGALNMSPGDVTNIRAIARRPDAFTLLSRSLAPSIYGHKYIKQALALMMLGGREHNLANGTHIRGDINVLLVGDPSTAKSQLLRFVLHIAPLAINTTGRGSSGVGLTAAVTSDPETGERRLEAGAMVLADRGIVCIDEFDKMSDVDRVAIHEVMEQQTVTIAKAGIQASLNARCSVVAAANPIYGRFDNSLPLQRNVALPDSLLSRFDLVFIVRDRIEEAIDARLAGHVLRMHRYQRPGSEGMPVPLNATALSEGANEDRAEDEDADTPMFQKYSPLLHGGAAAEVEDGAAASGAGGAGAGAAPVNRRVELLTIEFIKKFVSYVKAKADPRLTDEARNAIVEIYADFRQRNRDRATVITARSLETVIRLSTAHAKCRLSKEVTPEDVEVAREIMSYALYADAKQRKDEGPRAVGGGRNGAAIGGGGGGAGAGGGGGGAGGGGGSSGSAADAVAGAGAGAAGAGAGAGVGSKRPRPGPGSAAGSGAAADEEGAADADGGDSAAHAGGEVEASSSEDEDAGFARKRPRTSGGAKVLKRGRGAGAGAGAASSSSSAAGAHRRSGAGAASAYPESDGEDGHGYADAPIFAEDLAAAEEAEHDAYNDAEHDGGHDEGHDDYGSSAGAGAGAHAPASAASAAHDPYGDAGWGEDEEAAAGGAAASSSPAGVRSRRSAPGAAAAASYDDDDEDPGHLARSGVPRGSAGGSGAGSLAGADDWDGDAAGAASAASASTSASAGAGKSATLTRADTEALTAHITAFFRVRQALSADVDALHAWVRTSDVAALRTMPRARFVAALHAMEAKQQIMMDGEEVHNLGF